MRPKDVNKINIGKQWNKNGFNKTVSCLRKRSTIEFFLSWLQNVYNFLKIIDKSYIT